MADGGRLYRFLIQGWSLRHFLVVALVASILAVTPQSLAQPPQAQANSGPPPSPPEWARMPVPAPAPYEHAKADEHGKPFEEQGPSPDAAVAQLDPALASNSATNRFFHKPGDGTHVAELFTSPVNYLAEDGTWKPVDNTLQAVEGGYSNRANAFDVFFPERLTAAASIDYSIDGGSIKTYWLGTSSEETSVADSSITYKDVRPFTDVTYALSPSGYAEFIRLASDRAPEHFEYRLETDGLTLEQAEDGSIAASASDQVVAVFAPPFAEDSTSAADGGPVKTYDLDVDLRFQGPGTYSLRVDLPHEWMAAPERVFPVTVDPDLHTVKSTEDSSGVGSPLIKDTWADSQTTSTRHLSPDLKVGGALGLGGGGSSATSYLTFDVRQQIRQIGPLIYKSLFRAYNYQSANGSRVVDIKRITQHWDKDKVYNGPGGLIPGVNGDDPPKVSHSCDVACGWEQFDLKTLMQWWMDREDSSVPTELGTNHGLAMTSDSGPAIWYRSGDYTLDTTLRPYLETVANGFPTKPTALAPVDGRRIETTTPTLHIGRPGTSNAITDVNQDPIVIKYQVARDASFTDVVWQSGWLPYSVPSNSSVAVPAGQLLDGKAYYWRATSADQCVGYMTDYIDSSAEGAGLCEDLGRTRRSSEPQPFAINLKVRGIDKRWSMWTQALGNGMELRVNQANGNLVLTYPVDSVGAEGKTMDIGLAYNSHAAADGEGQGLGAGWELSAGAGANPEQIPVRMEKFTANETSTEISHVALVTQSGRRDLYVSDGSGRQFVQAGPLAGVVRYDAQSGSAGGAGGGGAGGAGGGGTTTCTTNGDDCGWSFHSYSGGTYHFDNNGVLRSARPSTSTASQQGFDYNVCMSPAGKPRITQVTGPGGINVRFKWGSESISECPGTLSSIVTDHGTWAPVVSNSRLASIADPLGNLVTFEYDTKNRLIGIRDARQQALGLSTQIGYWPGTSGVGGAPQPCANQPPEGSDPAPLVCNVKLAGATHPWAFYYLDGFNGGGIARRTSLTDPRGTASTGDAHDFERFTYFDFLGLPITIDGPRIDNPNGTQLWPRAYKRWDSNGNLVCSRTPAANAIADQGMCTAPNAEAQTVGSSDGLQTDNFYQPKAPYLITKSVGPAKAAGAGRLVTSYGYDEGFDGLVAQYFDTRSFRNQAGPGQALPKAEELSPFVNWTWPSDPAQLPGTQSGFSVRFMGKIRTSQSSGTPEEFRYRFLGTGNARLIIGQAQVFDCITSGCTHQNGPVTLQPGWHNIVLEYQAPSSGQAIMSLQQLDPGADQTWHEINRTELQPYLNVPTSIKEGTLANPTNFSTETYSYVDAPDIQLCTEGGVVLPGCHAIRGLPTSTRLEGSGTTPMPVDYTYDKLGRVKKETDGTGFAMIHDYGRDPQTNGVCERSTTDRESLFTERFCTKAGDVRIEKVHVYDPVTNSTQIRETQWTRDLLGRPTAIAYPDGGQETFEYWPDGRIKTQTVKVNGTQTRTTSYTYTPEGWLSQKTLPDPDYGGSRPRPTISFQYDKAGGVIQKTDERGKTWAYENNALGLRMKKTSPSPISDVWKSNYDAAGLLWKAQDPSGVTETLLYNARGEVKSEQLGTRMPTTHDYDARGYEVSTTDPDGVLTSRFYDAAGHLRTETAPVGSGSSPNRTAVWEYDSAGMLLKASDFGGDETFYTNDKMGRVVAVDMPLANGPKVARYTYNRAGELVRSELPGGPDGATNPTITTTYRRDSMGRVKTEIDGLGNSTTLTYDLAGQTTLIDDPRGLDLEFQYDGLGNKTQRRAMSGSTTVSLQTFLYDNASNLTDANVDGKNIHAVYDEANRIAEVTLGSHKTSYVYSNGRLQNRTDDDYPTHFGYNDTGRLNAVWQPFASNWSNYDYSDGGRVLSITHANGIVVRRKYEDPALRMTQELVTKAGAEVARFDLEYSPDSHVTKMTQNMKNSTDNGSWQYTYDGSGRLETATDPQGVFHDYTYDGAGNRIRVEKKVNGNSVTDERTSYNAAGRPVSSTTNGVATRTYTHDAAGQMTTMTGPAGGWRYDYDAWGNVTNATQLLPPASTASPITQAYSYDALDRPLEKTRRLTLPTGPTSVTTEKYSYTGLSQDLASQVLSVTGLQEVVQTETFFAHVDGQPVGELTKTRTLGALPSTNPTVKNRHIGLNPHGDVAYTDQDTFLSSTAGSVFSSYTYDPWGVARSSVGDTTYLGYQGDPTDDDTGLVDMGARLYVPELGRFLTQDPLSGDPSEPTSTNAYIYGLDDPITRIDPTGMSSCEGRGMCTEPGDPRPPGSGGSPSGSGSASGSGSSSGSGSTSSGSTRDMITIIIPYPSGRHLPLLYHPFPCRDVHCNADNESWSIDMGLTPDMPNGGWQAWVEIAMDISTVVSVARLGVAGGRWLAGRVLGKRAAAETSLEIVERVARAQVARGTGHLVKQLSRAEYAALQANPRMAKLFYGQAVHRSTAYALQAEFPERFVYRTLGPDFKDLATGAIIELTTPGQVAAHMLRPGYGSGISYATYEFLPMVR